MAAVLKNSSVVKGCVHQVFKKVDKDKNGAIDKDELSLALIHLHYLLKNKGLGVADPPSGDEIDALMKDNDKTGSGTLNEEEFLSLASKYFNVKALVFVRKIITTSIMSMLIMPESAALVYKQIPYVRYLPKRVFKVAFGIVLKFVSARLPGRM